MGLLKGRKLQLPYRRAPNPPLSAINVTVVKFMLRRDHVCRIAQVC
jgi:Fe2+ transport system protein FeoA